MTANIVPASGTLHGEHCYSDGIAVCGWPNLHPVRACQHRWWHAEFVNRHVVCLTCGEGRHDISEGEHPEHVVGYDLKFCYQHPTKSCACCGTAQDMAVRIDDDVRYWVCLYCTNGMAKGNPCCWN